MVLRVGITLLVMCGLAFQCLHARSDFIYRAEADPAASPDSLGPSGLTDVWSVVTSGSSANSSSDLSIQSGSKFWLLGANSGYSTYAWSKPFLELAGRPLGLAGDYVSLVWRSGSVGTVPGSTGTGIDIAFSFLDSLGNEASRFSWVNDGPRYLITDASTSQANGLTTVPFTIRLTLDDSTGGYTLNAGGIDYSGRQLANGITSIDEVRVSIFSNVDAAQSSDIAFNDLAFSVSAVPEPSSALMVLGALTVGACARLRRMSKRGTC